MRSMSGPTAEDPTPAPARRATEHAPSSPFLMLPNPQKPGTPRRAWLVAGAYGIFATLWIYHSDHALQALVDDPAVFVELSVYKGLAFVVFTTLMLLLLTKWAFRTIEAAWDSLARSQAEILRLNRLYAALTHINQAIVGAATREELFRQTCEVLVGHGGFRMAWVGWHDLERRVLVPVAAAGDDVAYLERIVVTTDGSPLGQGPSGRAFRTGEPVVCNDILASEQSKPWHQQARRRHFNASAAFPVRRNGTVAAMLNVYAIETGYFADREVALLKETAADLSAALDNLDREAARQRAERELKELNETLEGRVAERTEALRQALERAEGADRIKSAFLATMSHELRTPLNSIIGFTGILLQELAGPVNDEQRKQLGMVRGSARHLLDLINDVLDISKIEAGQLELRRTPFAILPALEQVTASLQPMAARKGLELRLEAGPGIDHMTGDQRRFEQIVLNLVNNAVKFTEHGRVTLTAECLAPYEALPGRSTGPSLHVCVADTGPGIRPEQLGDLFQPFRQLDTGLDRQHEGTGLGLAICRRLVDMMGGTIHAESEWSKGSRFHVILPLTAPAPHAT